MINDRAQKAEALRYVVAKRWIPQLEVNVLPNVATSSTQKPITDIDLLAMIPDEFDGFRLLLLDCKTKKGESPIARALWQRGLMDHVKATRGICILRRDRVETDHRYNAAQLGVLLLTEEEFDEYVNTTRNLRNSGNGNIADIDLWQTFFDIPLRHPALSPAIEFSRSGYWMCQADSESCRKTIAILARIARELDPARDEHMAVVGDFVSLFMLSLSRIVHRVFISYLKPAHREELSEALLLMLYGGRDSYEHRNSLLKLVRSMSPAIEGVRDLSPPEWDAFIQLVRHCLDAPLEACKSPLLVREFAWSYLTERHELDFARTLASESPQAAKLAIIGTEYLCKAAKLPPEFSRDISRELLAIQQAP